MPVAEIYDSLWLMRYYRVTAARPRFSAHKSLSQEKERERERERENVLLSIIPIERDGYLLLRRSHNPRGDYYSHDLLRDLFARKTRVCSTLTIFLSCLREWRVSAIHGCALLSQLLTGQESVKRRTSRYPFP